MFQPIEEGGEVDSPASGAGAAAAGAASGCAGRPRTARRPRSVRAGFGRSRSIQEAPARAAAQRDRAPGEVEQAAVAAAVEAAAACRRCASRISRRRAASSAGSPAPDPGQDGVGRAAGGADPGTAGAGALLGQPAAQRQLLLAAAPRRRAGGSPGSADRAPGAAPCSRACCACWLEREVEAQGWRGC